VNNLKTRKSISGALLKRLQELEPLVGNTPCVPFSLGDHPVYAKIEAYQLSGSAKIRPAFRILREAILKGQLHEKSVVVESTSGNFGVALAHLCGRLNLEFVPVIDPNIPAEKEAILRQLCSRVIKVREQGPGGFLITRLVRVSQFLKEEENAYHPDQYKNPNNYLSYYDMANEVIRQAKGIRHVFVGVSSGGCITGMSRRLKQLNPEIEIIAVDVEGSKVFGNENKSRSISGIGSALRGDIVDLAMIDRVVVLSESQIVEGAHALARDQGVLLGASSGAVYMAAKLVLSECEAGSAGLMVCPDDGRDYIQSIYDEGWVARKIGARIPRAGCRTFTIETRA